MVLWYESGATFRRVRRAGCIHEVTMFRTQRCQAPRQTVMRRADVSVSIEALTEYDR